MRLVRTRYAFVALAVLTLVMTAVAIVFTVHAIAANDRKFCDVMNAFTATPVQAPASPKASPARESQFEWYERFLALGRSLGC